MATRLIQRREIPKTVNPGDVMDYLNSGAKNRDARKLFKAIKQASEMTDEEISGILEISPKTFRYYKNGKKILSWRLSEHAIALYALFNHGENVFGSLDQFKQWLTEGNFYFGNIAPGSYLQVINGIKFLDDRLTAMEFGDNV